MTDQPSRYHFTDKAPFTVQTAEGEVHLGDGWLAITEVEYADLSAIRSLSQPVEGSAGASVGPGYSAEPEPDDTPCTSCNDTGWNFQTERPCACGAVPSSAYEG